MQTFSLSTPVLFLIFNRPDLTKKVFNEIRKVKPKKLFIAADGPRKNNPEEFELCQTSRKIIDNIDWDCKVSKKFNKTNLGCKNGVSSAISWFFSKVESGIILEDDCLPNQSFFSFCEEMLNRYEQDERIMQISGNNFLFGKKNIDNSYYFSKINDIWGWATWERAWNLYDIKMIDFPEFKKKKIIYNYIHNKKIAKWLMSYFEESYETRFSVKGIWSTQWSYAMAKNNGLIIVPKVNLVANMGIGDKALHSGSTFNLYKKAKIKEIKSIIHPRYILPDNDADDYRFKIIRRTDPRLKFKNKLQNYITQILK